MISLVFDENISVKFAAALHRRYPEIDSVHAIDLGWKGLPDPMVLAECASISRVLVTADKSTMPRFALEHVRSGNRFPGMIVLRTGQPANTVLEHVAMVALCSEPHEMSGRIEFLPW